jgi:hypothetical protein
MMLNQLIVYTTIFGNYDELIDPKEKYPGCDFICFTDQKSLKSDIWQIQIIEGSSVNPMGKVTNAEASSILKPCKTENFMRNY